jgi:predicted dehydrogenase
LSVGILGYGRFGRFLHLAWGREVVAVCDERPIAVPEFPARTYGNWMSLLEDPEVTIVSIATEPATHAALAVEAMEAGKHVIVEKPLALTWADAHRVIHAARRTGRVATVDHVLRFHPLVRAVERIAREELLGPLRTFALSNHAIVDVAPPGHWFWDQARSGGILVEHGVHFFDLAARLAGSPARELGAFRQVQADGRTDGMAATVQHANGVIAHHAHVFCRSTEGERTAIDLGFERGTVTLTGWIPLEGEVWAEPGLETLDRVQALLPRYRPIEDGNIRAARGRFSLKRSKEEVYRACLRTLLENLQAAAEGREPLVVALGEAAAALETALRAADLAGAWVPSREEDGGGEMSG